MNTDIDYPGLPFCYNRCPTAAYTLAISKVTTFECKLYCTTHRRILWAFWVFQRDSYKITKEIPHKPKYTRADTKLFLVVYLTSFLYNRLYTDLS